MKIIIYEDNPNDLNQLLKFCSDFFKTINITCEYKLCENSNELLQAITNYDLCFLDIELGSENGIDLGSKIRIVNKDIRIILVSNYPKYLIDGYKINAERYFIKPLSYNEFKMEMELVVKDVFDRYLGIKDSKISNEKIYYNDILYIEFYERKTIIHLSNGTNIPTNYSLKEWLSIFEEASFAKPHRAFIVNLKHVHKVNTHEIILTNRKEITLSRHYKKQFLLGFMTFSHRG